MQVFKKRCHCEPVRTLAWQSVSPVQTDFTEALRNLHRTGYGLPRRFAPRNDSAGRNPVVKICVLTKPIVIIRIYDAAKLAE